MKPDRKANSDRSPPTSDRLRKDIDEGRAGDKVGFPDPSAAPLGTDDEAAGTPPDAGQLRRAAEAEIERPTEARSASLHQRPVSGGDGTPSHRGRWMLWGGAFAVVILLGAALIAGTT